MASIVVPARFNGPPDSGNGGYTAGLVAEHVPGVAEITLAAPPPLECAMQVRRDGDRVVVADGERVIATACPSTLALDVPPLPAPDAVAAMSRCYIGFEAHPFPTCFTCGPDRAPGDGLRVFAGRRPGDEVVAAPWEVATSVADRSGEVSMPIVWAALDCAGYASFASAGDAAVLGRMTAEIDRPPSVGERCTVVGWSLGRERRKRFAATALYGEDGTVLARAAQVWIAIDRPPAVT